MCEAAKMLRAELGESRCAYIYAHIYICLETTLGKKGDSHISAFVEDHHLMLFTHMPTHTHRRPRIASLGSSGGWASPVASPR